MVKQQFGAEYDYCAFISFSSEDAKIADWLKRRLDRYNIPTFIRREHNFHSKRLKPSYTYLHSSEAGGELLAELTKKLEHSRYLIVVCSPHSAVSTYCNWEIETFVALGRKDYIIPIVVDGIPYSDNSETECLCPKLKEVFPTSNDVDQDRQIKCANLHEKGISILERRQHAFIQIVARILGVNSDKLWSKVHFRNIVKYILATILLLFTSTVILGAYSYYKTSYEYYLYCDDCDGIPTGIIPIDEKDLSKYPVFYRLEKSKHRVDRVVCTNSYGNAIDPTDQFNSGSASILEVIYESAGDRVRIVKRDKYNNYLYDEVVSQSRNTITLSHGENDRVAKLRSRLGSISTNGNNVGSSLSGIISPQSIIKNSKSKISRYLIERDVDKYITKKMYHTFDEEPMCDADGIYGIEYKRDSLHREVELRFLDQDGESPASNQYGISCVKTSYDSRGNVSQIEYLDENGNPVIGEWGYARKGIIWSQNYDKVEYIVYDDKDLPCVDYIGAHRSVCYLEKGVCTKVEYYDENGNLVNLYNCEFHNFIGGYAIMTQEYENGLLVSCKYYDKNGDRSCDFNGISRMDCEYDEAGRVVSQAVFNAADQRCVSLDGTWKITYKYNSDGQCINATFYNINNVIDNNRYGIAMMEQIWENGFLVEQHFYDASGLPSNILNLQIGANTYISYDKNGNISKLKSVAADGNGVVMYHSFKWNSYGQIEKHTYHNANGEVESNPQNGVAIWNYNYDYQGRLSTCMFYNQNEIPCYNINGYAGIQQKYVSNSNQITGYDFYDLDGKSLIPDSLGVQKVRYTYSDRSISSVRYYNSNHSPVANKATGVHLICIAYNNYHMPTKISYYGIDGEPVVHRSYGCHSIVIEYDSLNRINRVARCNENGYLAAISPKVLSDSNEPVNTNNELDQCLDPTSAHALLQSNSLLSHSVAACELDYTEANILSEMRFYNSDNELIIHPLFGASSVKKKHDIHNREVETIYLDNEYQPVNNCYGIYRNIILYDTNARPKLSVNLDKYGNYTCPKGQYFAINYIEYNDNSQQISQKLYDDNGVLLQAMFFIWNQTGDLHYISWVNKENDSYKVGGVFDYVKKEWVSDVTSCAEQLKSLYGFDVNAEHIFDDKLLE